MQDTDFSEVRTYLKVVIALSRRSRTVSYIHRMKTELRTITALSDQELTAQVIELARHERGATASLVAHLAEFGARKLYLGQGCATLFTYCTEVLHLSEHETYLRITAARLSRRFPVILDKLQSGTVNLTTLKLLRKILTSENHARLLAAAEHKSKRQVEELVVSVAPQPAVEDAIRKLKSPAPVAAPALQTVEAALHLAEPATPANADPIASPAAEPPAVIAPLAPELYKVQFTADAETHAKLRRAQELLRHQIPSGDLNAVIDRALTLLVAHLEKTRLGATSRPRAARPTRPGSRHVPAAVRRVVWERDGGICRFTSADGKRCSERGFSEFHHAHPHGDGGRADLDNIELRCRAHNQYEADLYFGPSNEAVRNAAIRKRRKPGDGQSVVRESPALYGSQSLLGVRSEIRSGPNFGTYRNSTMRRACDLPSDDRRHRRCRAAPKVNGQLRSGPNFGAYRNRTMRRASDLLSDCRR